MPVTAFLTLISAIVRSSALTACGTAGLADLPAGGARDANTLYATTSQLAGGLTIALAAIVPRAGGLFPAAARGTGAAAGEPQR